MANSCPLFKNRADIIANLCLHLSLMLMSLILIFTSSPVFSWTITPDLKNELAQKQAAVKVSPNDPYARFDLAITMAYTNNLFDGWSQLKKTVELDPDFKNKGLSFYIDKVNASPGDWRLRFRLAFAYYFNDKKKEAVRELDNVIYLDPDNVWAYGYIALIYGDLGNIDKAMEYTKRGLQIDANVAALHLLLSEGYYKKGNSWGGWAERLEALRLKALGY